MIGNRSFLTLRVVFIHLVLSAVVALLAAWVVFRLWFPYPYGSLIGGLHLFWILVGVDLICGPLLTAVLFNPAKSRRELFLDFSLIGIIQIAALAYGVHSISLARPVVLAFEVDRMVAVSASQIDPADLHEAPPSLQSLSWGGPVRVGVRSPKNSDEFLTSMDMSLQGVAPSARPSWWQSYDQSRTKVQAQMKSLQSFRGRVDRKNQAAIDEAVNQTTQSITQIYYLPLVNQRLLDNWIILLNENADTVGFARVDGFE